MVSSRLVRRTAVVVCAGGIAGMIVSSILNHNGAAITFGLITAAAVLCSMVATAVAADVTRQLSAAPARAGLAVGPANEAADEAPTGTEPRRTGPVTGPATGPEGPAAPATSAPGATDEEQAALVETLVAGLVQSGADEHATRELVRQSVRLGRLLATR